MLASSIHWLQVAKYVVPLVVLFECIVLLRSRGDAPGIDLTRPFQNDRKLFVSDFLQHEIDGAFDGRAIAEMCDKKEWKKDWIVQCDAVPKGVGTVRNGHLQCLRFAIEMGAGGLILPAIVRRSEHDIAEAMPNVKGPARGVDLGYFFDRDHLTAALSDLCPKMRLYTSMDELHDVPSLLTGIRIKVEDLDPPRVAGTTTVVANLPSLWDKTRQHIENEDDGRRKPLKIQLAWSPFWYTVSQDPPEFVENFGRLLQTRRDIRRLAGLILFKMQSRFGLNLDPRRRPGSAGVDFPQRLADGKTFLGVRMRTDRDAQAMGWPGYNAQAPLFSELLARNHVPVVYLTQGMEPADARGFARRAEALGTAVVRKEDLLDGVDLEELNDLSWDQRALVDYEVMLWAGVVAGIAQSSFAWNLAVRRKVALVGAAEGAGGLKSGLELPPGRVEYMDPYSLVFGTGEKKTEMEEAMRLTIWP